MKYYVLPVVFLELPHLYDRFEDWCCSFCRPPMIGIDPISWKNLNPELLISTLESTIEFRLDAIKDSLRRVNI